MSENLADLIGNPSSSSFIYQNPLLNPTNSSKNVGPSSMERNVSRRKSEQSINNGFIQLEKPEGWSEFVDHNNFIDTMLQNVQEDSEPLTTTLDPIRLSTSTADSSVNLVTNDTSPVPYSEEQDKETDQNSKPRRRIGVPWRNLGSFTTRSRLRQEAFDSFMKMSPDPPRTPPQKHVRISLNQPRRKAWNKPEPNIVVGYEMKLVPDPPKQEASVFPKPMSIRLPAHSRMDQTIGPAPTLLQQAAISLNKKSPIIVQPMKIPFKRTDNSFNKQKEVQVLYPQSPSISVPLPMSKRVEKLPQNKPTMYHTMYYGNGRRFQAPMPPQVNVKKVFANGSGQGQVTAAESLLSKQLKQQKISVVRNVRMNMATNSNKKIPPAKMFPIHVPGPTHDNIYISDYLGSDEEEEAEAKSPKGQHRAPAQPQ